MARCVITSLATAMIVIACGRFDSGTAERGSTSADAGTNEDASRPRDASVGCRVLIDDSFEGGANGAWNLLGQARAVDGELELIPNEQQARGGAWLNVDGDGTGVLRATFKTEMDVGGADGLTFAWSAARDPKLGGGGADVGICEVELDALAVAFRDLDGHIQLLDATDCTANGEFSAVLAGTHDVSVTIRADRIDVDVDVGLTGRSISFVPHRTFPVKAIGFTAGSGAAKGRHAIDDVHVELCPE